MQTNDFVISDLNFKHVFLHLDPLKGFMKNSKRKFRVGDFGKRNCYGMMRDAVDHNV